MNLKVAEHRLFIVDLKIDLCIYLSTKVGLDFKRLYLTHPIAIQEKRWSVTLNSMFTKYKNFKLEIYNI